MGLTEFIEGRSPELGKQEAQQYRIEGNIIRRAPRGTEICPSAQDSHPREKIYNGTNSIDLVPLGLTITQKKEVFSNKKWDAVREMDGR